LEPIRIVPLREGVADLVAAPAAANFTYRGGPLLESVEVVTVFWGEAWSQPEPAALASELNAFFDEIVTSPYLDQLAEYSTAALTIGHGSRTATATLPAVAGANTVSDAQIRQTLQDALAAGELPRPGPNSLYTFFLPSGVSVEMGGGRSCQLFCGYHDAIDGRIFYAVLPSPDCAGCSGGLSLLDALTVTASHELAEAVTDPVPGQGWYDDTYGEIGDVCAWQTKQLGRWTVQLEWSNTAGACV
jgi:hypothetical protein